MDEQRLTAIDHRVQRIHNVRPLPPETRRSLAQALRTRITYASNAIEGNRLTLAETQVVLEGVTVGGKPLTDHLEAIDHAEAWDAVIHWSRVTEPLTPHLLRSLHALVLRRSRPDESGRPPALINRYVVAVGSQCHQKSFWLACHVNSSQNTSPVRSPPRAGGGMCEKL